MANALSIAFDTDTPNAAFESSINGGGSWQALTVSGSGTHKTATRTGVAAATYTAGQLKVRAVGFPSSAVSNVASVVVEAGVPLYHFIFVGDSRYDTQGGGTPVPDLVAAQYAGNTNYSFQRLSYPGAGVSQAAYNSASINSRINTEIKAAVDTAHAASKTVFVILSGPLNDPGFNASNGMSTADNTAACIAANKAFHAGVQALGVKTAQETTFMGVANSFTSEQQASEAAVILAIDADLRTNYRAAGYNLEAVADVISDSRLATPEATLDTTIFFDGGGDARVHLTAFGKSDAHAPVTAKLVPVLVAGTHSILTSDYVPPSSGVPTGPQPVAMLVPNPRNNNIEDYRTNGLYLNSRDAVPVATVGGHKVWQLDGSKRAKSALPANTGTGFTALLVVKAAANGITSILWENGANFGVLNGQMLHYYKTTGGVQTVEMAGRTSGFLIGDLPVADFTQSHNLVMRMDVNQTTAAEQLTGSVDNSSTAVTFVQSDLMASGLETTTLNIGSREDGSLSFVGDIRAMLYFYDVLTPTQCEAWFAYVATLA